MRIIAVPPIVLLDSIERRLSANKEVVLLSWRQVALQCLEVNSKFKIAETNHMLNKYYSMPAHENETIQRLSEKWRDEVLPDIIDKRIDKVNKKYKK